MIDPANLLEPMDLSRLQEIMQEAELVRNFVEGWNRIGISKKGDLTQSWTRRSIGLEPRSSLPTRRTLPASKRLLIWAKPKPRFGRCQRWSSPVLEELIAKLETEEGRRELRQTLSMAAFLSIVSGWPAECRIPRRSDHARFGRRSGQAQDLVPAEMLESISPKQD